MTNFQEFFRMETADAQAYAVEVLRFFKPEEPTRCAEIGDGNINYVFRIWSEDSGRSLVIKQADKLLRSSGRPLDTFRSRIEAELLRLEGELAPDYVPKVYHYDETMSALSMEDISAYGNLRRELQAGRVYGHLGEHLSSFLAQTLLPTTDLVLDRREKKRRAQFFVNPELCEITEDLVLTEPFWDFKGRNTVQPENLGFVEELLYGDEALRGEAGLLREGFMNHSQALLHGDLHSGSIFANETGIKVIDPEFAFYGPMGYDIGNVIGNLFFAWARKAFTAPEETETIAALRRVIQETTDKTWAKLEDQYDALVTFPLYRAPAFRRRWLEDVRADAFGYAGTEILRRTVGGSKVPELSEVTDASLRAPMERALVRMGIWLMKERRALQGGAELTERFQSILEQG